MSAPGLEVVHPRTPEEALDYLSAGEARFVAGGTGLQLQWAAGRPKPRCLVNLNRLGALRTVALEDGRLRIGAAVTLRELERDVLLKEKFPILTGAIRQVAAPTVRTLATLGGNVSGRTGCLLPVLLALGAQVEVHSRYGQQLQSVQEWLLRNDETLVEAIVVPANSKPGRWAHRKVGMRAAFSPSVIGVAGIIVDENKLISSARLAAGGGPVRPQRLHRSEAALLGSRSGDVDWEAIHAVILDEVDAPACAFRSSAYRRRAAANALCYGLGGFLNGREGPVAKHSVRPVAPPEEIQLGRTRAPSRWQVRPDGPAKIRGDALYLTDHREPGMLAGRILRASVPHARIRSIDTSAAEALPGVVAVVTFKDVPGLNRFGIVIQDQPAFCDEKVRYAGDAVAAVAAEDERTAKAALALIEVEYESIPLVSDPESALSPHSVKVHECGNLLKSIEFQKGDTKSGFAQCAHIVEAAYATPRQMHAFMETEGGYAFVDDAGILTVCAGGQYGHRDRLQLSRILAIPEEQIRIVSSPTGGAFGGKDELTVQPALALLALKTRRKVRLQLDRFESVLAGVKRHPMTIRVRTGCDEGGHLLAHEVDVLADGGAYASLGPGVLETALEHAIGPYKIENVKTSGKLAYTNNGVCGAFRGFGANQMTYAVECQIDRLAGACGLDPFEMRHRNLRGPGSPGTLGQRVAPSERLSEMLQAVEADPIWMLPRGLSPDGEEIIGTGIALNYQGNGLGTLPPDEGEGRLRLAPDGAIEALFGLDEIGQGLLPAIRAAVSRELGCDADDVRAITGDTGIAPDSGSTTASRGTYAVWKIAREAGPALRDKLIDAAAHILRQKPQNLAIVPRGIAFRGANHGELPITFKDLALKLAPEKLPASVASFQYPKTECSKGNARYIFAFGAAVARVAVSRVTGDVRVLELSQHTAAGPALDYASYLGQIEGGAVQGLGFTLSENAAMAECRYLTRNFDSYMLPTIADAPAAMSVYALEQLDEGDSYGPRGVGELGIGAVTPAIANAVADALGAWPESTPFNPETILALMAGRP